MDRERRQLSTSSDVVQQRSNRIKSLQHYFLTNLVEDPVDGTDFDRTVLDNLQALHDTFCPTKRLRGQ
jgi:hypothetical protein